MTFELLTNNLCATFIKHSLYGYIIRKPHHFWAEGDIRLGGHMCYIYTDSSINRWSENTKNTEEIGGKKANLIASVVVHDFC